MAERRARSVLVFCAVSPSVAAAAAAVDAATNGRWRRGGLVSAVVHNLGQELGAAAGEFLLSVFSRLVLSRARRKRGLVCRVRVPWRGQGGTRSRAVGGRVTVSVLAPGENIMDGWQTVAGLCGRNLVNVRLAAMAWLSRNVARKRRLVVSTGEAVAEGRRLDDTFVGK